MAEHQPHVREQVQRTRRQQAPSAERVIAQPGLSGEDFAPPLQRTIGNRAVGRLAQETAQVPEAPSPALWRSTPLQRSSRLNTRGGALQAALRVGYPDDTYEREADHVAQQVVTAPDGSASFS